MQRSRRIHLIQQPIWWKKDYIKALRDTKDFYSHLTQFIKIPKD